MASVFGSLLLLLSLESLTLEEATVSQENTQAAYSKETASEELPSNHRNDLGSRAPRPSQDFR